MTMNLEQALALGRRAKRCHRWRWAPGMLTFTGYRVTDEDAQTDVPTLFPDDKPDFRDPATLGWLLALVRDAWPTAPAITARFTYYSPERGSYSSWACTYWRPDDGPSRGAWVQAHGESEAEALVAALEAAGKGEE